MKGGMDSCLRFTKCILHVIFVFFANMYCIPTYLVWMWFFFWPLRFIHEKLFWFLEGVLFKWLLCIVSSWSWEAGYRVVESGDDIRQYEEERCLVLANHQSTGDVPLMIAAFQDKGTVTPGLLWIMDRLFRYTNFGLVSWTHGDYFITQGKDVRDYQLKKLERHLLGKYLHRERRWIVLFPEGGFLCKRLETSQSYARKHGYPMLKWVTLPRVGAMHSILTTLCEENLHKLRTTTKEKPLKYLIDVTICYPNGEPLGLPTICSTSRQPFDTYFYYRVYPLSEVPATNLESLQDWLYKRWEEKENLLEEFYRTGRFPPGYSDHEPRPITLSACWVIFLHMFFFLSTAFHVYVFIYVWSILTKVI